MPQLSALRDALATMALHPAPGPALQVVPSAPVVTTVTDAPLLTQLLDGLRSLGAATAPATVDPVVLPVTSFSAGHQAEGPLFDTPLEMLVAFVRWLLGLEAR